MKRGNLEKARKLEYDIETLERAIEGDAFAVSECYRTILDRNKFIKKIKPMLLEAKDLFEKELENL